MTKTNKSGFCKDHFDATKALSGANNPMAGKTVYQVWVEKYGIEEADRRHKERIAKTVAASKRCWSNEQYRNKIKETTTGLKRSAEFKEKQRKNAVRQFKDPYQRELRSDAIKASFELGTHSADVLSSNQYGRRGFTDHGIFYASNVERQRIEFLQSSGLKWKRYEVGDFEFRIKYQWAGKEHLYLPDFIIWKEDGSIIIEEMKSNIKYISDREWAKAKAAGPFLKKQGMVYFLNDDPKECFDK